MASKRPVPEMTKPEMPVTMPYFGVDALMQMQRNSIETMVEANRIFVDTAQAIARCQSDMMKDCVEQMTRVVAEMSGRTEPGAPSGKEGAAVQVLFEKAAGHVRDIAEVLGKSNAETIQLVNGRMKSLMTEAGSAAKVRESAAAE
jgi:phasin family protein